MMQTPPMMLTMSGTSARPALRGKPTEATRRQARARDLAAATVEARDLELLVAVLARRRCDPRKMAAASSSSTAASENRAIRGELKRMVAKMEAAKAPK